MASATQIVLARMCLGAAVLLPFVAAQRQQLPRSLTAWGHLTVAAVVASIVPYFLFAWAEQRVPSNVAGVLNATTPLFTLALAVAVRDEARITRNRLGGLLLGFAGAFIVLAPWREAALDGSLTGQAACLGAAASYAVSYVYMSRFLAGRGIPPLALAASQLTAASALLVLAAPAFARGPLYLTPPVLASIVALGALGTGVAYIINYRLIADEGPTSASTVSYLLPVVAVTLGVLVLSEPLTWNLLLGAGVVLAGVAISEDRVRPTRYPASRVAGWGRASGIEGRRWGLWS